MTEKTTEEKVKEKNQNIMLELVDLANKFSGFNQNVQESIKKDIGNINIKDVIFGSDDVAKTKLIADFKNFKKKELLAVKARVEAQLLEMEE